MATFTFPYTVNNLTGHTYYKVLYRVTGTSVWTSFLTSGTTVTIPQDSPVHVLTNNYIYDLQVENVNNHDNPYSAIVRAIGFTDPDPLISPTNTSVSFSFANLSYFIDYYTCTIALFTDPGNILQSQILSSGTTISGSFSGLTALTDYVLAITPVASEFSQTFTHNFTTSEAATCAVPTGASAYLSSGLVALHMSFTSPAILPARGFSTFYRTKGTNTYTSLTSSGTTGSNSLVVPVTVWGCYEGYTESVCAADEISGGVPFGTNAYTQLTVVISTRANPLNFIATISSPYPNPYDTVLSGTFISATTGSHNWSAVYDAGSTSAAIALFPYIPASGADTVSSYLVGAIAPVFDNGGSVQQFDSLLTPSYSQFYNILSSGISWTGNPAQLPSFTLDTFEVTEQDVSENVLGGILVFSWIYQSQYGAGAAPYNTITFEVHDPADNSTMGTVTLFTTPLGLRTASMAISKQVTAITSTNIFNLVGKWSDASTISTVPFYLPVF